jgi:hypothetical protein
MLKHIVFIKLKSADENERTNSLNQLKDALSALPAVIPVIQKYDIGINISDSASASDLAIVSEFNSIDDLKNYLSNPEHLKILDLISSLKGRTAVVDFEM